MVSKSKTKKSPTIDYGPRYEFRDVRYWIYKRRRNPKSPLGKCWHMRIKIKNQPDIRKSTGKENLRTAREKAQETILECLIKMDSGQIIHSRKFQQVSGEFLDDLKHNPKTIDSKFKKYSSVVNNFLNEYLGKYPVNSINEKVLYEYKKWRKSYWKNKDTVEHTYTRNGKTIKSQRNYLKNKPVSLSTLHKEDVVLRQILEHARLSGDIDNNKVIKIKSESFKSSRRPCFTLDEWKKILKVSSYRCSNERLWKNKNNEPNKKYCVHETTLNQRKLLHEYINFMVGSGLRTTESINLKWSDITENEITEEVNGKFQLVSSCKLSVSGKSKKRKCDPQPYVKEILDRVKRRQVKFSKKNGFKFTGKKEYVWSDENGHRINSFSKSFTSLLESCDLLYDAHNCKRVIGSLRHTYGTFRKNLGEVDTYELAIQMGTSPEMIQQHYIHHDDYDRSTAVTRIKKSI